MELISEEGIGYNLGPICRDMSDVKYKVVEKKHKALTAHLFSYLSRKESTYEL